MNDLELLSFDLNTGYLGESNGYNSSVEITLKFFKKIFHICSPQVYFFHLVFRCSLLVLFGCQSNVGGVS